ncbi:MAG: hypothetical protein QNJ44_22565 [Rhodobacter sp.]|nr:hypothetical protein [Rhodobacter sp.]
MFDLNPITGGVLALALAGAGVQTVRAQRAVIDARDAQIALKDAEMAEARAIGELQTCAARIVNMKEALKSNASIPDDLTDFAVPDHWMRGEETRADSAGPD